jgi:hypothetical protein
VVVLFVLGSGGAGPVVPDPFGVHVRGWSSAVPAQAERSLQDRPDPADVPSNGRWDDHFKAQLRMTALSITRAAMATLASRLAAAV